MTSDDRQCNDFWHVVGMQRGYEPRHILDVSLGRLNQQQDFLGAVDATLPPEERFNIAQEIYARSDARRERLPRDAPANPPCRACDQDNDHAATLALCHDTALDVSVSSR